jgi:hypothetical protein
MCQYVSEAALLAGLESIKNSPKDQGMLELIVIRPKDNQRIVLVECALSSRLGVHGDMWAEKCWKTLPDGSPHPDVQLAIMNSRCIAWLAQEKSRWPLAGDQLYIDMDLSGDNLPVGQRLAIGTAILQITDTPHTGCGLFAERYGQAAVKFVNSPIGKRLHLRGIYAKVIHDGLVRTGDIVTKINQV